MKSICKSYTLLLYVYTMNDRRVLCKLMVISLFYVHKLHWRCTTIRLYQLLDFKLQQNLIANEIGSHWVLTLLYLKNVPYCPEDDRLRSKHVAIMWPECICNITVLIYCCVLAVYNTLYIQMCYYATGRPLSKSLAVCKVHSLRHKTTTHSDTPLKCGTLHEFQRRVTSYGDSIHGVWSHRLVFLRADTVRYCG